MKIVLPKISVFFFSILMMSVSLQVQAQTQALDEEKLTITTFDQQKLSAIWTNAIGTPRGAVLILPGSGNVGTDGDVSSPMLGSGYQGAPAKLSDQIASVLAAHGIASLRYAKRGKDDPAQYPHQTIPYLVKDAQTALQLVMSRSKTKVGMVGFSEGAIIAALVSKETAVDALFLLSFPTRPIDDVFGYQFTSWPTELIEKSFDPQHSGTITSQTVNENASIPMPITGATLNSLDLNKDHQISILEEVAPFYQSVYLNVRGLLSTPDYANWYESMKSVPLISELAPQMKAATIYAYAAKNDAQIRWNWIFEDAYAFKVKPTIRTFDGVGHCFSKMDGSLGQIKTSGPLNHELLMQLSADAEAGLK